MTCSLNNLHVAGSSRDKSTFRASFEYHSKENDTILRKIKLSIPSILRNRLIVTGLKSDASLMIVLRRRNLHDDDDETAEGEVICAP